MITLDDILIERAKKEEKFFKNYLKYAKVIKQEVEKNVGKIKVYIFGSILKKKEVSKDIDILIISPQFEDYKKKNEVIAKIWRKLGPYSPFELHLITPKQYKNWYKFFIKKKIKV